LCVVKLRESYFLICCGQQYFLIILKIAGDYPWF
jgi:hypothetical protein